MPIALSEFDLDFVHHRLVRGPARRPQEAKKRHLPGRGVSLLVVIVVNIALPVFRALLALELRAASCAAARAGARSTSVARADLEHLGRPWTRRTGGSWRRRCWHKRNQGREQRCRCGSPLRGICDGCTLAFAFPLTLLRGGVERPGSAAGEAGHAGGKEAEAAELRPLNGHHAQGPADEQHQQGRPAPRGPRGGSSNCSSFSAGRSRSGARRRAIDSCLI
mmetsp:Transcript_37582/g.119771  ORF Transcript_37582/g.119771 Transcript_37582/m.119771 type:complete len:221 (+) Transcript_37582:1123-1785(+)